MKTIIFSVLVTLLVVVLIAAATTRITVSQIVGSSTVGQVITTTAIGVVGWATPAASPNFADAEIPTGVINGTNAVFTVAHTPITPASVELVRNGVVQQGGGNDYTLSAGTITFTTGSIPQSGDTLQTWYRF